ncbi:hypothetical protein GCM10025880_68490 [Methylorubrum aminovorans]|nr:hypothetical protein [Methylorubrum aminovorans]GMA80431.1 hypothetical protein GCM10025880_68490 [Methylorubrum aminovorans]
MTYSQTWNLESIYPGGITSPQLKEKYKLIENQIQTFTNEIADYNLKEDTDFVALSHLADLAQTIGAGIGTVSIFINGWSSVDYGNSIYGPHFNKLGNLWVAFSSPLNTFQKLLSQYDDDTFSQAINTEQLEPIAFYLTELRTNAKRLLDDKTETLINKFDLDGQQAWSQHYDTISSSLSMTYTDENGKKCQISAGQALNMLDGEPDNNVRANIMINYEKMWKNAENLTSDTLNHLVGFRLTNQEAHGRQSHLEQPLELNRMSRETLDAMWQVVDANKSMFKPYFERKKELLGLKSIGWQDQVAPLTNIGDYQPTNVSYDEAAKFIMEQFNKFSPKMASFAKNGF